MPNNYFSIRDSGVITCYVATEFESITEIIAALAKAFRHPMVNPHEPEAEKAHLLTHSGAQFQPITEEVWRAHVEALKKHPSGDRRIELNFDTDCARFTDWRSGQYASITGSLCRIINAYDSALIGGRRLDGDRFAERIAFLCDVDIIRSTPTSASGPIKAGMEQSQ